MRREFDSDEALLESQSSLVVVNLNDNRFDRPIFDHLVYNFTVDENIPLDTIIGQVNAVYLHRPSDENGSSSILKEDEQATIRYRIVPFVDGDAEQIVGFIPNEETADVFSNALPVRIDADTGRLSVRLNVDREKFSSLIETRSSPAGELDGVRESNKLGLIRFNIEASYASSSYSYAKVTNI